MVEKHIERKAVIDLGTNTFNLLIAEPDAPSFRIVHHEKLPVLLGMGGINEGYIANDAMERAKEALTSYAEKARSLGVKDIIGIGTSALRDASNSDELITFIKDKLGFEIQIVSGIKEAEYIYKGVALSFDFDDSGLIMDIGGGSTEFVYVTDKEIDWSGSFDIGVSRIYQLLEKPDEFDSFLVNKVEKLVEDKLGDHLNTIQTDVLIGSSGTFETLYEIIYEQSFPDTTECVPIDISELRETLDWCIISTLEERMNNEWIVPLRKKMLPIAAVKIRTIIEKLDIKKVFVSPFSLKEGVFAERFDIS